MLKRFSFWGLMISIILLSFEVQAQLKYQENTDYFVLETPIESIATPKVIEFFWFGCPHCNNIRNSLDNWIKVGKPKNVEFEYVPAVIGSKTWDIPAQAYYTMKSLNIDLYDAYFDAIFNKNNRALLGNESAIRDFFMKEAGISAEQFDKAWKSFDVAQQLKRAQLLFKNAKLDGTPSFVVNGKYVVPVKGDYETVFDMITVLANKK